MINKAATRTRDDEGRYDFDTLALICRCGHALGLHASERPRDCFAGDNGSEECDCEGFKKGSK